MSDDLEHVGDSMDILANEPMDLEQIKLTLAVMQLDPADRAVIRVAGKQKTWPIKVSVVFLFCFLVTW